MNPGAIRLPTEKLLEKGKPAEFTVFDVVDADLTVRDSQGALSTLHRLFEPRHAILGAEAIAAHRARTGSICKQSHLLFLDPVFHLTACAIHLFINHRRRE